MHASYHMSLSKYQTEVCLIMLSNSMQIRAQFRGFCTTFRVVNIADAFDLESISNATFTIINPITCIHVPVRTVHPDTPLL